MADERNEARTERDYARVEQGQEHERFQELLEEYTARMVEVRQERSDLLVSRQDVQDELSRAKAANARLQDGYDGLKCQYDEEHDELSRVKVDLMDAQETIDGMRAEGCAAADVLQNIFNGATAVGVNYGDPTIARITSEAAAGLVDVPVCEHKDELKRLREVVYNYLDFTPGSDNNKCRTCGAQWYLNKCLPTCLHAILFKASRNGNSTSFVWLDLTDSLDDARATLDKIRALCDDDSTPMGRRHVLALLPARDVIKVEAAKRKEDGE